MEKISKLSLAGLGLLVAYEILPIQYHKVKGNSMAPTIHDGDVIIGEGFLNIEQRIEHADIVIFSPPGDQSVLYVKRVYGLPNEYYETKKLGEHEYWVLGDNKEHSADSREFGPINNIGEKVIAIYCTHQYKLFPSSEVKAAEIEKK